MITDWQEMESAPKNEAVLICLVNCDIIVALQKEGPVFLENGKETKGWRWSPVKYAGSNYWDLKPLMWSPCPLPPKHLYERKLTADLLQKQVNELRGLDEFGQQITITSNR